MCSLHLKIDLFIACESLKKIIPLSCLINFVLKKKACLVRMFGARKAPHEQRYSITPESNMKVMRIKEMITN